MCTTVLAEDSKYDEGFAGWQGLASWRLPSGTNNLYVGNCQGDERAEIVLLNRRQARLEIFSHNHEPVEHPLSASKVNRIPLPSWVSKETLICEGVPVVAAILPDQQGIAVVSEPGLKVHHFTKENDTWQSKQIGQLERGRINTKCRPFYIHGQLHVPMQTGLQTIALTGTKQRGTWLEPRQSTPAIHSQLIDIDGDDEPEIVDVLGSGDSAIRIWQRSNDAWQPPISGLDRAWRTGAIVPTGEAPLFLGVETNQQEQVRVYRWQDDTEASHHRSEVFLPSSQAPMTGILIEDEKYLVSISSKSAELNLWQQSDNGWTTPKHFPFPTGVTTLAALPSSEGPALLAWRKAAGELMLSHWNGQRFSYPKALPKPDAVPAEAAFLRMGTVGQQVWAIWQHKEALYLVQWVAALEAPQVSAFNNVSSKINDAAWLGGQQLLVQEKFGKGSKLLTLKDGDVSTQDQQGLPVLKTLTIEGINLAIQGDEVVRLKYDQGIVQILNASLEPIDQWQLPNNGSIQSLIFTDATTAQALAGDGRQIFHLTATESGIPTITETIDVPQANWMALDPVLGALVGQGRRCWQILPGASKNLIRIADIMAPAPPDIGEPEAHRVFCFARDNGEPWVILSDDRFQQLSLLTITATGESKALASWPVFEDEAYPYGGYDYDEADFTTEPQEIHLADLDGDGQEELIMVCHDRCLVYLSSAPNEGGK